MSHTSLPSYTHDPDSTLDYTRDWSDWLEIQEGGPDTITASSWEVPVGLTMDSSSFTDTTATVWISGAVIRAEAYTITNRITTAGGRTDERSISLKVRQR